MKYDNKRLIAAAYQIMEAAGNPAERMNTGIQHLVRMRDGTTANLKTAGKGGLMVKTRSADNDSDIIGFDAGVTHILAAVCLPNQATVTAYLIPIEVVEAAYRRNNKEWSEETGGSSTTWVLKFRNTRFSYYGGNMAKEWADYAIGSIDLEDDGANHQQESDMSPKAVLERARSEIAEAYGVNSDQVRISVDL